MADPVVNLCSTFTRVGLERECKKLGLTTRGSKAEMAKRIVAHNTNTPANDDRQSTNDEVHDGSLGDGENDPRDDASSNDDAADDDGSMSGASDDAGNHHNDDENDEVNSSSDAGRVFHTALHSTPKSKKTPSKASRPYSFRDVEDSIESFGAEDGRDVKVWIRQFEEISAAAYWTDEQRLIMLRKKLSGTARRFVFTQRDVGTFAKLKRALIAEFAPLVRACDGS